MRRVRSRNRPGWSPLRFAFHSAMGHRRGQTAALVAVSALITASVAFAPVYDRAMQQALVDTLLAQSTTVEKSVTVVSEAQVTIGGAAEARDPRDLEAMVPREVAARLGPLVLGRTGSVTPIEGAVPPTGPLVWREGACAHVEILSGRCPDKPGEILVSEVDVDNFGLSLGSVTDVGADVEEAGPRLEVVGTYEQQDTEWWQGQRLVGFSSISRGTDPSAAHDAWLTTEETFVDAPILPGESSQAGSLVRTESTGVDELLALEGQVRELSRDVADRGEDLRVQDELRDLTTDVRSQAQQAHRIVPLLMAPLAVLTVFVLWLVLGAAVEQRRGEVAVARLRGRGRAGAVRLLLTELLPVLLLGVIPGAAAALLGGLVARALLPGTAPFEAGPGFAAAIVLAVVAIVVTTALAATRVGREPLDALLRRGQVSTRRWALGALDAFLIAAVGTGVLAFATGSLSGPFALAGPALLALLAGLLVGHLAAPAASGAGRRLLQRGRLVSGVTLLETGRRRETRAVIAVLTVASALAVFAVDGLAVGERNRANASEHDAGAPVVLRLAGSNVDAVRSALSEADPTGLRATPVLIAGTTLAVEPAGFREVAFFPRGAPTAAQWQAIAAPDVEPVVLTGSRVSLVVRSGPDLSADDAFSSASAVVLSLVVSTSTGTRQEIRLGEIPDAGKSTTLVATDPACARGCRVVGVDFTASPGVRITGQLEIGDLLVDDVPVALASQPDDWNTTETSDTLIRPSSATGGALALELNVAGLYPAELTPAWVPQTIPAILPTAREDSLGLEVTGADGSDRKARSAGRVTLIPAMPRRSALVDLDAISRGAEIAYDAHAEVWLVDDTELVDAVTTSLRERGVVIEEIRRVTAIRRAYDDTVAAWSLALGSVVGPAVLLLALLVLLVLATTGWRERARDLAIMRLNGAGQRTIRRLALCAQLPTVALAIGTGVGAGLAGAALAMPDVVFFPAPPEAPVVDPSTIWPAVLWVAAACGVVLPAAALLTGRAIARRAQLELVREAG